jgi:hypothetical protein
MLKFNRLNRFSVFSPEIISAMLIITFAYFAAVFYIAPIQSIAQNISSTRTNEVPSSIVMYRILVDDVAKSLQSGDMQAALVHLYIIKQQLASASTNSSVTLGPILISVLKLGSNVTKGVSQTKWYQ